MTFVASIPAVALLAPVLDHKAYIVSGGSDTRVLAGCFLDFVNAIACIGRAVVLFPVVRRPHEGATRIELAFPILGAGDENRTRVLSLGS